jgi:hypothetical protein
MIAICSYAKIPYMSANFLNLKHRGLMKKRAELSAPNPSPLRQQKFQLPKKSRFRSRPLLKWKKLKKLNSKNPFCLFFQLQLSKWVNVCYSDTGY